MLERKCVLRDTTPPTRVLILPTPKETTAVDQTPADCMGLDIGLETVRKYSEIVRRAKTIVWSGPMGVFENPKLAQGTLAMARAVAESNAFSIVGGGDSAAAVAQSGMQSKISPKWWNRQTHHLEWVAPRGVRVRIPPSAFPSN